MEEMFVPFKPIIKIKLSLIVRVIINDDILAFLYNII
jgi:hypothetical protein